MTRYRLSRADKRSKFLPMRAYITPFAIMLFVALLSFPVLAQDGVFNAKTATLSNGLQVVVIENNRAPVVTHMVWYKVGAADEAVGQSGIAHFLEHLLFKGSDGLAPGEFSKTVRALGGNDNAFTSYDYTAYFQSIASRHLEKVMRMEAGRMRGAKLPETEVASERLVILEERRQRTDNSPSARFSESLNAALYENHPYGTPIIGWMHEMEQLDRQIAYDFYRKWYAPNNAILIVSGDVEAEDVFEMARIVYGNIGPSEDIPAERMRPQMPPVVGTKILEFSHSKIQSNSVRMIFRAPSFRQDRESSLALQVFQEIMGAGPTSRLYRALVVDQKLATDIGLYYQGTAFDNGEIHISASLPPGVSHERVYKAIKDQLSKFIAHGPTEEEVRSAIGTLTTDAIYARDSVTGPAMIIGQALTTGSSLQDIETWPAQISAVTGEQIQQAAERFLSEDENNANYVVGYLKKGGDDE